MKLKVNLCNIVLLLICMANVLNLFVPRFASESDSGDYLVRLPIQVTYGLMAAVMVYFVVTYNNSSYKYLLGGLRIFLIVVIAYLLLGYAFTVPSFSATFSQYLRLSTWIAAIMFFTRYANIENKRTVLLTKLYIILFMIVATKKMIEIRMIVDERNGGDTTGLTLVLLIPIILMIFKNNMKVIMTVITIVLIMLSIRRTAIIALVFSLPYIYKELKSRLKPVHIFLALIFLTVAVYYAWDYLGDTLYDRFASLFVGDHLGEKDSYGSGRSIFYMVTFDGWQQSSIIPFLFGHGVGAVREILHAKYGPIDHTHNDILEILYTYGLVGFFVWMYIIYRLFRLRKIIMGYSPERLRMYDMSLICFLIISIVSGTLFKVEMLVYSLVIGFTLAEINKKKNAIARSLLEEEEELIKPTNGHRNGYKIEYATI